MRFTRIGGVISALIWAKGMKDGGAVDLINGGAVDLTDGGVEGHCFANPLPAGGFLSEYWGSRRTYCAFFTPCRCALAVFREEARKALRGIKKGQCGCSGAAVCCSSIMRVVQS